MEGEEVLSILFLIIGLGVGIGVGGWWMVINPTREEAIAEAIILSILITFVIPTILQVLFFGLPPEYE